LPDVTVVTPLLHDGELLAYAASIAHHSDIGGAVPGGIAGNTETIYAEGLRIPPVRLVEAGQINEGLLRIFRANCRQPDQRETDLRGQLAANRLAKARLRELCVTHGSTAIREATAELLGYGERSLRAAAEALPDGAYTYRDALDSDGVTDQPVPIQVTIHVSGIDLRFDFAGSSPQVRGAINVPTAALRATVYYAVKAVLAPDLPPNGGFHRAIRIRAPEGSIVNPSPPAAVGARTDTCQIVAGAILGAFAQALPGHIPAPSHDTSTSVVFSGVRPDTGDEFVYVEAVGGGGGARPDQHGLDGVQVHVTNTANLPVEVLEQEYPLRVERYELRPGSGGAGKSSGGRGLRRDVRVLCDGVTVSTHADRHERTPAGLHGGHAGTVGAFVLNPGTPSEKRLPSKITGMELQCGDVLSIRTPGGAGYGDPGS